MSKKCGGEVAKALTEIWGEWDDSRYEAGLLKLESAVLEYIEQHPELKKTPNNEDMWDFFDGNEDVDDEEDEW